MAAEGQRKLKIRRTFSDERKSRADLESAQAFLAKLAARAFARDHPELFGPHLNRVIGGPANHER